MEPPILLDEITASEQAVRQLLDGALRGVESGRELAQQDALLTVNVDGIRLLKDILGVPGIHIKPLRLDPERGEWVFLAVLAPGCSLPIHYHTGPAQAYTLSGRWLSASTPTSRRRRAPTSAT